MDAKEMTSEKRELWARVEELWQLALKKDTDAIREALHPNYSGWEASSPRPHDREHAVQSIDTDARITEYKLHPVQVEVYDGLLGIVHYTYSANVAIFGAVKSVTGRWTEIYLKKESIWLMTSVQGGPYKRG